MDLQKLRQDFKQRGHDVKRAVEVKNKVAVSLDGAQRLADQAVPFKHHTAQGKFLRYKNGQLYSKQFSPTELLARLGDEPSQKALKAQSEAALDKLAGFVDRKHGAGTAERIGLTKDHAALTSRTFEDLDYHAAAAAALHALGVCSDASLAQRDAEVQALKVQMRHAVKADKGKGADLSTLARECATAHYPTDVKELTLAKEALAPYGLSFPNEADEQAAIRQIKLEMQPLLNDPANPMTAQQAAQRCALRYHLDLEAAESALKRLDLLTQPKSGSPARPSYEVQRVLADLRKPPLSALADRDLALKEAVLRHALHSLPGIDDALVQRAANELAQSPDFGSPDAKAFEWVKAAYQQHKSVTAGLVRQARLDALLKQSTPDPVARRDLLQRELRIAANSANDPAHAFPRKGYIGKTMAEQANQAQGMDTFLSQHLPGTLNGLVASLPSDLAQHDPAQLRRDTVQALTQLFTTPNLENDLPPTFREDLRLGIEAIDQSDKTDPEKSALRAAWRHELLAKYVLAPAIENHVSGPGATRTDARTAAVLLRESFLKVMNGPTEDERQHLDAAELAAWEQCLRDWRDLMVRAARV